MGNLLRRSLGSVIAHGIASGPSELGAAPTSLPLLLTMGLLSCRALAIAPPDRFKTRSASCSGAGSAAVHQSMVARAADGERRSTARTVPDTYCLDGTAVGALALAGRRRHCGRHLLLHGLCVSHGPLKTLMTIASINLSLVPMSSDNGDGIDDADGKIDLDCQTASDLRGRSHPCSRLYAGRPDGAGPTTPADCLNLSVEARRLAWRGGHPRHHLRGRQDGSAGDHRRPHDLCQACQTTFQLSGPISGW
jgi:hypothetical protein